jgi:hypothetical protein
VIAYVMPTDRVGTTQVASATPGLPARVSDDADQDGGIPSPIDELLAAINAERAGEQPALQAQAREPARPAAVERPRQAAERPEPRRNYRVVQQVAAADVELPRPRPETVYRVSAVVAGTPLPRERAPLPSTPLPRSRPQ